MAYSVNQSENIRKKTKDDKRNEDNGRAFQLIIDSKSFLPSLCSKSTIVAMHLTHGYQKRVKYYRMTQQVSNEL